MSIDWVDKILERAERVIPRAVTFEIQEFHVPRRVGAAASVAELRSLTLFKDLRIMMEKNPLQNQRVLVLTQVDDIVFTDRPNRKQWVMLAYEAYDDERNAHVGTSFLVSHLEAVGPAPVMVGAFDPIMYNDLPYFGIWIPASIGRTDYPVLAMLFAGGTTERHQYYQRYADPLVRIR
jgi:hypothetical protein